MYTAFVMRYHARLLFLRSPCIVFTIIVHRIFCISDETTYSMQKLVLDNKKIMLQKISVLLGGIFKNSFQTKKHKDYTGIKC